MIEPTHLLTVHTLDKRGIIAGVTGVLGEHGAHVLELSQTVVRDYFTIVLIVALPADTDTEALTTRVRSVVAEGAAVVVLPYRRATRPPVVDGDRYVLTASGADSAGVIHTISTLIAERGGNFADLDCRVEGEGIRLVAEIELPRDSALDQLQIDLEHAGVEAGLQVRLQHQRLFQATNEVTFRRLPA